MTDPKRWCDDPQSLSEMEWRVLMADARLLPPPQAKSLVWANLAPGLGVGSAGDFSSASDLGPAMPNGPDSVLAGSGATHGGAAGHALSLTSAIKAALVGVGIGASLATVSHYIAPRDVTDSSSSASSAQSSRIAASAGENRHNAPSRGESALQSPSRHAAGDDQTTGELAGGTVPMVASGENVTLPSARLMQPEGSGVESPPTAARAIAQAAPFAESAPPNAREESQLISSARTALRSGDSASALRLLELAESRYPQGVLVQEREALRVEALAALGRTEEVRVRAQAFLRAYPTSPHADRVKGHACP